MPKEANMNEVKKPKKTMLVFYLITLAIVMLINMVLVPLQMPNFWLLLSAPEPRILLL